jgi:photosystem II stability/assembly factor-like uncharacterized protein
VIRKFLGLFFFAVAFHSAHTLHAQGTAFMYQGQLNDGGSPANGIYDLRFGVFDAVTNGNAVSGSLTNLSVPASNGLFVVTLDFGVGVFTGPDRWLDIAVRASGATNFTALFPRQKMTPTPYAIFANSASNLVGNLAAAQLTGTLPGSAFTGFTNSVILTNGANSFAGTFSGSGTNLVNLNASQLTGGTVADARLSTNVALLNANQTFSGANNFTNFGNSFVGSFFGNGLVGWIPTNGMAIQAQIDHGYLLTNSQVVTVTLPTNANAGDIVRISGAGAGGWQVAQSTNQFILGNFSSFANSFWLPGNVSSASWDCIAASADGSKMVAVASLSGISVSTDSGATWTPIANAKQWRSVASSADGSKLPAVVFGGGIYTNSGTSWTVTSAPTGSNWISIASSADGSRLVAAIDGGEIYTSTNSGATWTNHTSGLPGNSPWISVASSANGSNLLAAVDTGGIYTSSNSGTTWAQQMSGLPSNPSWQSVASSADGSKLAAAIFGGKIYASVNSGVTWTTNNAPVANWESIASSADGSKLAAVVDGGGIYLSSNFGVTWTQTNPTNGAVWSCIASSADGTKLAATILGGGIYHSQTSLQSSTTTGTNGYISGVQGSAVELQYTGLNQWMPVSSTGTIWAH